MKKLIFVILLALFCFSFGCVNTENQSVNVQKQEAEQVNWYQLSDTRLWLAKQEKKCVFIYFHYQSCAGCDLFKHTVLKDPKIVKKINSNFMPVMVSSLDSNFSYAVKKFDVHIVPRFVILDYTHGNEIMRGGFLEVEQLSVALDLAVLISNLINTSHTLQNSGDSVINPFVKP